MEIRSGLESLNSLLGVPATEAGSAQRTKASQAAENAGLMSDTATLSSAGTEASQAAGETSVRSAKVEAVRAALEAGTYSVPTREVASKMVDSMIDGGQ